MQIPNIPAPDDDNREIEDNFDTTSDFPDIDETTSKDRDVEEPDIPLPPDEEPNYPVKDPPVDRDTAKRIV